MEKNKKETSPENVEIHTKRDISDDPLSQIMEGLDDIQTRHQDTIKQVDDRLEGFSAQVEDLASRLKGVEDGTTPVQREAAAASYARTTFESEDHRMAAYTDFMTDIFNRAFGFGDESRAGQNITTDADGGFLVPDPLSQSITRIIESNGVARKIFQNIPMTTETLRLNRAIGPSVAVIGEGSAITAQSAQFTQETMTAKKIAAIDELTMELEEDAIRPIVPILTTLFGEAIAKYEDVLTIGGATMPATVSGFTPLFKHTGGTAANEIRTVSAGTTGTTLSGITYDDVVNTMHGVDDNLVMKGKFLFSPDVLAQLRKLKDVDNNPIWSPFAGSEPSTILGRPYIVANQAPNETTMAVATDPVLMYGDYSYSAFGTRSGLEVAFSADAGFATATRFMRVMERIGFVTIQPQGPYARLELV